MALSTTSPIGRAEKWKNAILKYADVDYHGTIYIKQGSIEKNRIFKILAGCFFVLNSEGPFVTQNFFLFTLEGSWYSK